MSNILIFGNGYVSKHFIEQLRNQQHHYKIYATSRTVNTNQIQPKFNNLHIINFFDINSIQNILSEKTKILITTPTNPHGDPTYIQYYQLLQQHKKNIDWIGYLSSTSVYGEQNNTTWVNETTDTNKNISPLGQQRLKAEKQWLTFKKYNINVSIMRLAGIYGPQKNPVYKLFNQLNIPIIYRKNASSRIHVTDIVNIIQKLMSTPENASDIFNIADDLPEKIHKVYLYAYQLTNIQAPMIPEEISYITNNQRFLKKIDNSKIKKLLNLTLKYPSYKEGLLHEFQRHRS